MSQYPYFKKNIPYTTPDGGSGLYDLSLPKHWNNTLLIFVHGYMGFKDWGCWNMVEEYFTHLGFGFLKMNTVYNGFLDGDILDKESFAKNTYYREYQSVIECVRQAERSDVLKYAFYKKVMIGHSRGGGLAILSAEALQAAGLITWAAVADFEERLPQGKEELAQWQESGIREVVNSRTGLTYTQPYALYTEYYKNREILSIPVASKNCSVPWLIVHAKDDQPVALDHAMRLKSWGAQTSMLLHEHGGHTLGSQHPWTKNTLPAPLQKTVERSAQFILNTL